MHCVFGCSSILPFSISSNCSENICADGSFCNGPRIFMINRSVSTLCHKNDCFKHALISSSKVERGITGKVCRKSPDKSKIAPPKSLLLLFNSYIVLFNACEYFCDIVNSSKIIIELPQHCRYSTILFDVTHCIWFIMNVQCQLEY